MSAVTSRIVSSSAAAQGAKGQLKLAAGKAVSLRMWKDEPPTDEKPSSRHSYEVAGYAISGKAELVMEGETVSLKAGDSWIVPADVEHAYRILEPFTAIEAVCPPERD